MSWYGAREFCRSINGRLAEIMNVDKVHGINKARTSAGISHGLWFGLNRGRLSGWVSGSDSTGQAATYTNWGPGEPNGAGNTNCAMILSYEGGEWNDGLCTDSLNFLCEKF